MRVKLRTEWQENADHGDGWWVINDDPNLLIDNMGPYTTKREAEDDRQGVERFLRGNLPFFTVGPDGKPLSDTPNPRY